MAVEPPHAARDVTEHLGYRLKQAHAALRGAMDDALRPFDLTVPQYASLEILALRPGLSNAELARATFVTPQSANVVTRTLQAKGLIDRPDTVEHGRARPARLTPDGHRLLEQAQAVVYAIETRMVEALPVARVTALLGDLDRVGRALRETSSGAARSRAGSDPDGAPAPGEDGAVRGW